MNSDAQEPWKQLIHHTVPPDLSPDVSRHLSPLFSIVNITALTFRFEKAGFRFRQAVVCSPFFGLGFPCGCARRNDGVFFGDAFFCARVFGLCGVVDDVLAVATLPRSLCFQLPRAGTGALCVFHAKRNVDTTHRSPSRIRARAASSTSPSVQAFLQFHLRRRCPAGWSVDRQPRQPFAQQALRRVQSSKTACVLMQMQLPLARTVALSSVRARCKAIA